MTRADIILLLVVMFSLPFIYRSLWNHAPAAGFVHLILDDHQHRKVSLNRNQNIEVNGALGLSRLEIKDGRIRFTKSPCKGKVCIRQGWQSAHGDFAACLPNKVAIRLHSSEQQYDSINF